MRLHVGEALGRGTTLDRREHFLLDIDGVDDSIRTNTTREANREPAAAGTDVANDRGVGDAELVHDFVRVLPHVAIGGFEEPEVLRREQSSVRGGSRHL
jgi:hypothetical protein